MIFRLTFRTFLCCFDRLKNELIDFLEAGHAPQAAQTKLPAGFTAGRNAVSCQISSGGLGTAIAIVSVCERYEGHSLKSFLAVA